MTVHFVLGLDRQLRPGSSNVGTSVERRFRKSRTEDTEENGGHGGFLTVITTRHAGYRER
jgi:hypothetical protein